MSMLAEQYEFVIGGDPDRDTVDLAVVDSATGALRAHLADRADGAGYAPMLAWADSHAPGRRVWALEGTGSFAAGLAVFLAEAGEDVVEIGGVKRQRGAKNDQIDAARAARQALAREHQTKVRAHGLREALGMIVTTRQAILVSRTKAINELKGLIVAAPEPFNKVEGLFTVLMCADCQAARGYGSSPYPVMTRAEMRAGLDLLPTWAWSRRRPPSLYQLGANALVAPWLPQCRPSPVPASPSRHLPQ